MANRSKERHDHVDNEQGRPPADQAGSHGAGDAPDQPTEMNRRSWWGVLKRTVREFREDNLTDWAAALTYYGVLSIFPGLLVLVSVLALFGQSVIQPLIDNMGTIAPGPVGEILEGGAKSLTEAQGAAGLFAIVGLVGALWSASGYVAAFMRASNAIYDVPEGRPIWKTLPIRVGVTIVVGVMLAASALMVVLTGELADKLGNVIGVGSALLTVWDRQVAGARDSGQLDVRHPLLGLTERQAGRLPLGQPRRARRCHLVDHRVGRLCVVRQQL
jgi:membrane protein